MDELRQGLLRLADLPENQARVKAVEDAFGPFGQKLVRPDRALVGEGILQKVCKKKLKKRAFFLFSDILLYGKIIIHKSVKKYNGQHILDLVGAQVASIPDTGDLKYAFNVFSPKKSFTLMAVSQKEKQDWISHLEKCIMFCNGGVMPNNVDETDPTVRAPVWISDNNAAGCMCCSKKFTVLNRRHHCRSCGRVVCADCSKGRFLLPNISKEPQRVCDVCLVRLVEAEEKNKMFDEQQQSSPDVSSDTDSSDHERNRVLDRVSTFYGSVEGSERRAAEDAAEANAEAHVLPNPNEAQCEKPVA